MLTGMALGSSIVIGIRVPKWVKEELDKLGIDYTREMREFIMKRLEEEKMKRLSSRMDQIRKRTKRVEGNLSALVIRESRDRDWNT